MDCAFDAVAFDPVAFDVCVPETTGGMYYRPHIVAEADYAEEEAMIVLLMTELLLNE